MTGQAGHAVGPSRPLTGSVCRSWRREVRSSLVKTLARWYSTVRGLRNSWAAISGFDRPARASRAIWVSWGVSWSCASAVRLRTVSPVASSSQRARSANASMPIGPKAGAAQSADRLAIPGLSVLAVAEQRPGPRVDPLRPVGLADAGRLGQPAERVGGQLGLPGPAGRLDQLGKHPHGGKQLRRLLARLLRLGNRRLIAAEPVVKNGGEPLRLLEG